jgi:GNAT superfamily N-acetyltransferase
MPEIRVAQTDAEIARCAPVMRELRPHIPEADFVARVRRQEPMGYRLAMLEEGGLVQAVAGFRIHENLSSGRMLYVDDLVTRADARSRGHGAALVAWLAELGRRERCDHLELDSGLQRHDAHRFYLAQRMAIVSHHFRLPLR